LQKKIALIIEKVLSGENTMEGRNEGLQGSDICLMFVMVLAVWLWAIFR
jgi:hypothetical protein